ncbi:MAG: hypothetical protein MUF77_13975 [Leptospira sp.]|nr:hypothetical protein [Leptospira sp.]
MNRYILEKYSELISELKFTINRKEFPVFKFGDETDPAEYSFPWKPVGIPSTVQISEEKREKQRNSRELANFPCTLCAGKIAGIRNYFQIGRIPILVLHYSGSTSPKEKPFIKKQAKQIFRDKVTEVTWADLIQKTFGFSFEEFFYEEYPACTFSSVEFVESDWQKRVEACKIHLEENIKEFGIKAVLVLGSSARLIFGAEKAKEILGKEILWEIGGKQIPLLTLRSPEALVFLEEKSKKVDSESNLFQYGKEKHELEEVFIQHLTQIKKYL